MPSYLDQAFKKFENKILENYRREIHFEQLETALVHVNKTGILSRKDLEEIINDKYWPMGRWWQFPQSFLSTEFEKKIATLNGRWSTDIGETPKEEEFVRELYDIFKHIEIVSIILRFVKPDDYGIFSPPTMYMLQLPYNKDHVSTYLDYLNTLRELKKYYKFKRVADVDKALWVISHSKGNDALRIKFDEDEKIMTIRERHIINSFNNNKKGFEIVLLNMANALVEENRVMVAGGLAGLAFEVMARKVAAKRLSNYDESKEMKDILHSLKNLKPQYSEDWKECNRIRSLFIHQRKGGTMKEAISIIVLTKKLYNEFNP